MSKKIKVLLAMLIIVLFNMVLYIAVHELGHCLIAMMCGARITRLSILHRSMSYAGGSFNAMTKALVDISGPAVPYLVGLIMPVKESRKMLYNFFVVTFNFITLFLQGRYLHGSLNR